MNFLYYILIFIPQKANLNLYKYMDYQLEKIPKGKNNQFLFYYHMNRIIIHFFYNPN